MSNLLLFTISFIHFIRSSQMISNDLLLFHHFIFHQINAVAYFMTMQVAWRENALIANSHTNSNNNITKSNSSKNNSNNSTSSRSSNSQKKKAVSPMKKVCSSLAVVFILCLTWMAGFFYFIDGW